MRPQPFLLLLAACLEYKVNPKDDPNDGTDSDTDTEVDDSSTTDEDCEIQVNEAFGVNLDDACSGYEAIDDPWDLSVEWQTFTDAGAVMMPAVGQLDDDEPPEIAYVGWGPDYTVPGTLYVYSGDGSGLEWSAEGFRRDGGLTVADIDGDHVNDVVGVLPDGHVRALNNDGSVKWTSPGVFSLLWPVTTAADLDGDGIAEVIADSGVVSGLDGSTIASLATDGSTWRTPIAADLDLDGSSEILLAQRVFNADGTLRWAAQGGSGTSCFAAVYDGDDDPEAEVVFNWGSYVYFYEHDGNLTRAVEHPGGAYNPGPPCVGDIDGDGAADVIAPSGTRITAFSAEGDILWNAPIQDVSGAAGCSVYDMNGDGVYEVLFADEIMLRIYDGAGNVLYANSTHESKTYFEYPVVADVDADGSAEIVVASSTGSMALTVFGHNGSGWPPSGPSWGIHDYAFTNQADDGSLPAHPTPWLDHNLFRGRPATDEVALPDLYAKITDICAQGCEEGDEIWVAYQVSNEGGTDVDEVTSLAIYADGVFLSSVLVPPVPRGQALEGAVVVLAPSDLIGATTIQVVADDDGSHGVVTECEETDNGDEVANTACP